MSIRLLAPALIAATTATAAAQPAATPPSSPPQTHAWNEVNHINGTPVKVGETNEYEVSFRKTNISSNPIGWMAGFFGASVSHAVSDHIAVRADLNYVDMVDDSSVKFWEAGVGVPLYLKRTYSGPFVEPGIIVRGSQEHDYSTTYDSNGNYVGGEAMVTEVIAGPQMLFGWHLTWDSGFNVAAAAGIGRNLNAQDSDPGSYESDEEVFFNGYFRVGYAF